MNKDKAAHRLKRGGEVQHLALDFAGARKRSLEAPRLKPRPSLRRNRWRNFSRRNGCAVCSCWLWKTCARFAASSDVIGSFSSLRRTTSTVMTGCLTRIWRGNMGIPVTDVTNALAWARREFRRMRSNVLREICGTEEEFQREARATFGWGAAGKVMRHLSDKALGRLR